MRSNQIKPPDHERPRDGDRLECLGWQVGLPSIVLTPFVGAHNLFSVGYYGRPVETLSKCISDQGPRCGMVPVDPAIDISQQLLPLFDGDAALQDFGVASPIELALNNGKGLEATCKPLSLHFVHRQCLTEEVVEVRHPPVGQRVRLCCWILIKLHDFGVGWSRLVSHRAQGRRPIISLFWLLVEEGLY